MQRALDGARIAVGDYLKGRLGAKKAGVYAVIDEAGVYQYIGYARSLHDALKVAIESQLWLLLKGPHSIAARCVVGIQLHLSEN